MNRNLKIAAGAALAAVLAYPGAAWLLGKRVESQLGAQYQQLETQGMLKVVSRDYQRGVYGASETVMFETTPAFAALIAASLRNQEAASAPPLRWSVRSQIQHGPFPGGRALGAARMQGELSVEGDAAGAVQRLFRGQAPLTMNSLFGFLGGASVSLSSPAVKTSFQTQAGEQVELDWQGLQLATDFSSGMKRYSLSGTMPGLQIAAAEGFRARFTRLNISAEGKRILGEDSDLYSGWTQVSLDQAAVQSTQDADKGLSLQKLSYRVDMPLDGDFLDLRAKLGAESFKVAEAEYGPAHYDFSMRHLRAEALQGMQQAIKKLYANPANSASAQNQTVMFEAVRLPMIEILKQQPVFTLDRLAFSNAQGETTASGELKLLGAEEGDFANPFALIGKLDMKLEFSTPEKNAFALAGMKMPAQDAEQIAARDAMVQQQIEAMVQKGYLERSGSLIKGKLAFTKGALSLNGKPMMPGML